MNTSVPSLFLDLEFIMATIETSVLQTQVLPEIPCALVLYPPAQPCRTLQFWTHGQGRSQSPILMNDQHPLSTSLAPMAAEVVNVLHFSILLCHDLDLKESPNLMYGR